MAETVALLNSIHPAAAAEFSNAGLEVITFPKSISPTELADIVSDAAILGVRTGPKIPRSVIEAGDALESIGIFSIGTLHVDRQAADESGIPIFNSKHENTRSVAELVMGYTYGLARRIAEHSGNIHGGMWTKTDIGSCQIRDKTMGIIGYGNIGSQVSVLAEANNMKVVYYDPAPKTPPLGGAKLLSSKEAVLELADFVTVHVPGGMILDRQSIARMKHGSYLINAARGNIVDYEAAAEAYQLGQLGGIAVDVYEDEPSNYGDTFEHVLRDLDGNIILTPHIGASTPEAQAEIGQKIAQKLLGHLATGNTIGSVNLPEIALGPIGSGISRILNVHTDTIGVLEKISHVLASNGLNIPKSTLDRVYSTHVAYVAFDVEGLVPDRLADEIADKVRESRHTRIIPNGAAA